MALTLEIQKIPPEGESLAGALLPSEIDLELHGMSVRGGLEYDLRAEVVSHELIVHGKLRLPVEFTCSRCLKQFASEIRVEQFRYNTKVSEKDIIDLTENLREDIIIALPLKPLCGDECRGICPRCGKDRNVEQCSCAPASEDWRWNALEELSLPPENDK